MAMLILNNYKMLWKSIIEVNILNCLFIKKDI